MPNVVYLDGANCRCCLRHAPAPATSRPRLFSSHHGPRARASFTGGCPFSSALFSVDWSRRHIHGIREMGGGRQLPVWASPSVGTRHHRMARGQAAPYGRINKPWQEHDFQSQRRSGARIAPGRPGVNHAGVGNVVAAVRGVHPQGATGEGARGALLRALGATIPRAPRCGRTPGRPGAPVLRRAGTERRLSGLRIGYSNALFPPGTPPAELSDAHPCGSWARP